MTFLRELAAIALTSTGRERRGIGLRADAVPDHLFVPINGSHGTLFMTRYAVTRWQYNALMPSHHIDNQHRLPDSAPITAVTAQEAEQYCSTVREQLADSRTFDVMVSDEIQVHEVLSRPHVRLPTRAELTQVLPSGRYPWSGATDDSVAIARRLSYERLLPVGLFPDEVPESGIADIAGLVWHWLAEPWPGEIERNLRYVHGGGFGKNIRFLSSNCFLGADESTRRTDRGFRLVLELHTAD